MEKKILSKRKWLNPKDHEDSGAIAYGVRFESSVGWKEIDAWFDVWDCSRKASLSFCVFNHKDAEQRAIKIDMMIEALQEMKQAMGEAYNMFHEEKESADDSCTD